MKDLIFYEAKKFMETYGEVVQEENCLRTHGVSAEGIDITAAYLEFFGFPPQKKIEENGEITVLLAGEGDDERRLVYSAEDETLTLFWKET